MIQRSRLATTRASGNRPTHELRQPPRILGWFRGIALHIVDERPYRRPDERRVRERARIGQRPGWRSASWQMIAAAEAGLIAHRLGWRNVMTDSSTAATPLPAKASAFPTPDPRSESSTGSSVPDRRADAPSTSTTWSVPPATRPPESRRPGAGGPPGASRRNWTGQQLPAESASAVGISGRGRGGSRGLRSKSPDGHASGSVPRRVVQPVPRVLATPFRIGRVDTPFRARCSPGVVHLRQCDDEHVPS